MNKTKIIRISRKTYTFETDYRFTIVEFIRVNSETKTTYKTDNYCVYVYSRGQCVGTAGYRPSNDFNVFKKSLIMKVPEHIQDNTIGRALRDAQIHVLSRGQVFNATIVWWNENEGSGMADVAGVGFVDIHGCNALNALTCYSDTACINMTTGEMFSCQLADMGTHLTCINFTGTFDQAKSDSLDHSKLAFRKQNGKIVSGLFE